MSKRKKEKKAIKTNFKVEKKPTISESVLEKIISGFPLSWGIIIFLILIVFFQLFSYQIGKVDEGFIITNNLPFLKNFDNISSAFFRDAFFNKVGIEFYRPLQNVSYFIDVLISGGNNWATYLLNLLIHISTTILIFSMLNALSLKNKTANLLVALIFGVNPLFAFPVGWLPARGDMLIALFFVASFLALVEYLKKENALFLLIHIILFFLAVLSKETAVLAPIVFLNYYFFNPGKGKKWETKKITILIILYLIVIIIYYLLRKTVVAGNWDSRTFGIGYFFENLATIPEFISKFFIPFLISPMSQFTLTATILGLIIAGLLIWVLVKSKGNNRKLAYIGLLWFLLFTIPSMFYMHFMKSAAYDYLDHRAYLSVIGLLLPVYCAVDFLKNNNQKYSILASFIVFYGAYCFYLVSTFKTPMQFYDYVLEKNPNSALAYNQRGLLKADAKDFQGAISDYTAAIAIKSDYSEPYNNRGLTREKLNDLEGALNDYNKAISFNPTNPNAFYNRGTLYGKHGDFKNALNDFNRAILISPGYSGAYNNRANVQHALGDVKGACEDWHKAVELGEKDAQNSINRFCK